MTAHRTLLALTAAAGAVAGAAAHGQTTCEGVPSDAKLDIIVESVTSASGLMTASLYPGDASQFLIKDGALKVWSVPVQTPTTEMCIWLKKPGTYAIALYQDLDSNHKLNLGTFGPTEPYGFSNNPRIFLSKPSYEKVKFEAGEGVTTLHVRLHHP